MANQKKIQNKGERGVYRNDLTCCLLAGCEGLEKKMGTTTGFRV